MVGCSNVSDRLGLGGCPVFCKGCGVSGFTGLRAGCGLGHFACHRGGCRFHVACIVLADTLSGAGLSVDAPLVGGRVPGMVGCRNIVNRLGLGGCPVHCKGCSKSGLTGSEAGCRLCYYACHRGVCRFHMVCIVPADTLGGAALSVLAPLVSGAAPGMVDRIKDNAVRVGDLGFASCVLKHLIAAAANVVCRIARCRAAGSLCRNIRQSVGMHQLQIVRIQSDRGDRIVVKEIGCIVRGNG